MTLRERKRADIEMAALGVFLENGFVGASVDEIAARAHTSKRTVYAYFGDKEGLFRSVIGATIEPMQHSLQEHLSLAASALPRDSVKHVMRSLATIIVTPQVVRLRRVVIAETDRFPDLAAVWYSLGPAQTVQRLATYLTDLSKSADIVIDDPRTAAEHLLWLAISTQLNRLMFMESGSSLDPKQSLAAAEAGFEVFWRAYGAPDLID